MKYDWETLAGIAQIPAASAVGYSLFESVKNLGYSLLGYAHNEKAPTIGLAIFLAIEAGVLGSGVIKGIKSLANYLKEESKMQEFERMLKQHKRAY